MARRSIRFDSLKLRGIGPFRGNVELPLSELPDGIVAIVGAVGAGKSTLLEALAAALYRVLPNQARGKISSLATARDSRIEVQLHNGAPHRIVHCLDAASGAWEAGVYSDGDTASVTGSTKVRDFDRWTVLHLPPPEVFLASVFSAQESNVLVNATDGERKSILLRALGLERYEPMAKAARERAAEAKMRVTTLDARISDERARGGDVAKAAASLETSNKSLQEAHVRMDVASKALDAAQQAAKKSELAEQAYFAVVAERDRLESELWGARGNLAELEEKIRNNQGLLARGEEIRAAVERSAERKEQVGKVSQVLARLSAEQQAAERENRSLRQQHEQALAAITDATSRVTQTEERLSRRGEIEASVAAVERLTADLSKAEEGVVAAETELECVRGQRVAGADERIHVLRRGHEAIAALELQDDAPVHFSEAALISAATLQADDDSVAVARDLPEALRLATDCLRQAKDVRTRTGRALSLHQAVAAAASQLEAAEQDRAAATHDLDVAQKRASELVLAIQAAADRNAANQAAADQANRQRADLEAELARLAPLAQRAELLAGAQGRLDGYLPAAEQIRATMGRLTRELGDRPALDHPLPAPSLPPIRAAVAAAERDVQQATAAVATAQQLLEMAQASQGRVAKLEAERSTRTEEHADWARLGEDLGRNGLQAAEVDTAGPELTAVTNDLLHACLGSKFSVRVETTRLDSKGRKELEALPILVLNSETGYEGDVRTMSGGEKALLGEALQLGLTVLVCSRNGMDQGLTLVRDEPTAALEPEDADAYVSMLRRAAAIVRARQTLVVSHNPRVAELADAVVRVADGSVTIAR